jgi:hypothetical protein
LAYARSDGKYQRCISNFTNTLNTMCVFQIDPIAVELMPHSSKKQLNIDICIPPVNADCQRFAQHWLHYMRNQAFGFHT